MSRNFLAVAGDIYFDVVLTLDRSNERKRMKYFTRTCGSLLSQPIIWSAFARLVPLQ